jgi:phage-related protein
VRTISDVLKEWKSNPGQPDPIVVLYDFDIDDDTTMRLVSGNPSGTGSIVYQGNTYLAAAIDLQDVEETIESDLRDRTLSVSNISGVAGGYIETRDLDGRRVTITTVPFSTLDPADAVVETYTMQDQRYDRRAATVTLGHSFLSKRNIPWRRFQRPRCQQPWERRFVFNNGCGFPSDVFEEDTRQNFIIGSVTDGEQVRRFGWHTLNVSHASRMEVDPSDVPQAMYMESTSPNLSWAGSFMDGPYAYKRLTGDFDVFTQVELIDTRPGSLVGFLCQEAVGGQDSWTMWGLGETQDAQIVARLSIASDGLQHPDTDSVVTGNTFLRLKRVANTFTYFHGGDINDEVDPSVGWTQLAEKTFTIDADVRLGFVLSASSSETSRVAAGFRCIRFMAGGDPVCTRLIDGAHGCSEKGNVVHFLGFPGIPRR